MGRFTCAIVSRDEFIKRGIVIWLLLLSAAPPRAVDRNFDAIKPYMLEEGFAEADLETARSKIHDINEEQGWY